MLKKLGYISYLFGLEGVIFVIFILNTENIQRIELILILTGILIVSIVQMMFTTYILKTLQYRSYKKTGAIDEYLTLGMEDGYTVVQLPLFWRIIGWIVLICSIGVCMISIAFFSEYAFNQWKNYDIYAFYSILSIAISIVSFVYTLRVVNRKWIGVGNEKDEL